MTYLDSCTHPTLEPGEPLGALPTESVLDDGSNSRSQALPDIFTWYLLNKALEIICQQNYSFY